MGSGRVLLTTAFVGLWLALAPGQAHASCGLTPPLHITFLESEVIFVGTVTDSWVHETVFGVQQVWKGNPPEVVRFRTPLGGGSYGCCSELPRRPDEPILVYLRPEEAASGNRSYCNELGGPVSLHRGPLFAFAMFYTVLIALPSTVLLLTLSKALRRYHDRFLAG